MEYISLKKATKILDKEKKPLSSGYLGLLIRQGKLRAVKIGAKWFTKKEWLEEFRKKDLTSKTLHRKPSKERGFILPLYFGYGLKIALVKLTSNALNLTSKIFRRWWQEAVVLVLLVVLISSGFLFFQNVKNILAATFEWIQTDWSGGANTVDFPAHPADKAGWTIYYSKDTNIIAGTELTLTVTSASVTQNSYDVFNAGTKDDVYVSGGNVYLQKPLGKTCSAAIECVSGYCVDGVCCNTACTGSTCQRCDSYSNAGAGTCGYVSSSSQDPDNECGTTDCLTGNCKGDSYACGYYSDNAEHNCTTACTTCSGATSGSCVNMTDNTQDTQGSYTCSATCKKCSSGSCVNQGVEDLFSQCSNSGCYTGNCDGSGACGYQTSSTDTYNYCGTTGCYTGNCIGGSNACGYYSDNAEHNCTTACTTCSGATSGSCVNMTDNTQDTQGSYTCSATCKKCSAGNCVNQSSAEDLFNQCDAFSCGVILNEKSGQTCTTLCSAYAPQSGLCTGAGACSPPGAACGCASVGTDSGGTNGTRTNSYSCDTPVATCATLIYSQGYGSPCCSALGPYYCQWTFCKCGP